MVKKTTLYFEIQQQEEKINLYSFEQRRRTRSKMSELWAVSEANEKNALNQLLTKKFVSLFHSLHCASFTFIPCKHANEQKEILFFYLVLLIIQWNAMANQKQTH